MPPALRETVDASPAPTSPPPAEPPPTYGPLAYFMSREDDLADLATTSRQTARLTLRLRSDTPLLLSIAIAIPVLVLQAAAGGVSLGLLAPIVFVATQAWLATLRISPPWLPSARLGLTVAFIGSASVWGDPTGTWPLSALAVPVVALAAAIGGIGPSLVAVAGMALILAPLAVPSLEQHAKQEVTAVAMAALVVAIG